MDLSKIKLDKESRRNKGTVRFICLLDVILSLFLFAFYFIGGLIMNTIVFQVRNGPFSKITLIIISVILWAMVFGVTYLQLAAAYRLFLLTFQDALGPVVGVVRSHSWLRTSALVFGLIVFKMIYFVLRDPEPMGFVWVICLLEILFRLLGMYFIREFCDDLKHQASLIMRRVPPNVDHVDEVPKVIISKHTEV